MKDIKNILKKNRLIFNLNSYIKAKELKKNYFYLSEKYKYLEKLNNIIYSEDQTIVDFRKKLFYKYGFSNKKKSTKPKFLWVGANKDQDESGFIQSLKRITDLSIFKNIDNKYGLWYGDDIGNESFSYINNVRKVNDKSLIKLVEELKKKKKLKF